MNHGEVVADMFRCERELTTMLGRVRDRLDAELIAARQDRTPFKDLAFEVQRRLDLPTTANELERLSRALRQRTTVAHRRGVAVRAAGTYAVASDAAHAHDDDMNNPMPPYRRRVVDEWYSPDGRPPDVEDMNDDRLDGDDEFDGDDQDHDLGDGSEPEAKR